MAETATISVIIIVAELMLALAGVAFFMRRAYRQSGALFVPPSVLAVQGTIVSVARVSKGISEFHTPDYQTVDGTVAYVNVQNGVSTLPTKLLTLARCLVCLWFLAVQVDQYILMTEASHVFWSFSFFTVWNYHLQIVCFCVLAANSLRTTPGPKLRLLAGCLFELCLPMSILVSGVLWGVLLPSSGDVEDFVNFGSINQHLVNTLLLLGEFAFNRLLVRIEHIGLMLLWPILYLFFIWIQHAYSGFNWPYFFLELDEVAPLWYAALLVFHLLIFSGVAWVSSLKARKWALGPPVTDMETSILSEAILARGF